MSSTYATGRRRYGTGGLHTVKMADGSEVYYGQYRDGDRKQVKRRIGPVGLFSPEDAENALGAMMSRAGATHGDTVLLRVSEAQRAVSAALNDQYSRELPADVMEAVTRALDAAYHVEDLLSLACIRASTLGVSPTALKGTLVEA